MNRMTDRCKNITLPQTSFEGGNNNSETVIIDNLIWTVAKSQHNSAIRILEMDFLHRDLTLYYCPAR